MVGFFVKRSSEDQREIEEGKRKIHTVMPASCSIDRNYFDSCGIVQVVRLYRRSPHIVRVGVVSLIWH